MEISIGKARFLHEKHGFSILNFNIFIKNDKEATFFGKNKPYHSSMPVLLFGDKMIYQLIWTDKGRHFLLNINEIIVRTQQKVVDFMKNEEKLINAKGDKNFIKNTFYSMVFEVFPEHKSISLIFDRFFENFEKIDIDKNLVTVEMFQKLFESLNPKFRQFANFQDDFPLENDIFLAVTSRMIWYTVVLAAEMIKTCSDGKIEEFVKNLEKSTIREDISKILNSIVIYLDSENNKIEEKLQIKKFVENLPNNNHKIEQESQENEISVQCERHTAVSEESDKNDKSGENKDSSQREVNMQENGPENVVENAAPSLESESEVSSTREKILSPLIFHQHLLYHQPDYWPYLRVSNPSVPIHRNVISNPRVFTEFRKILIEIRMNSIQIFEAKLSKERWKDAPSVEELMQFVDGICEKILGNFYVKDMTCPISRLFGLPSISIPLQSLLELRRRLAAHFSDQHVVISDEVLDSCFEALARHIFVVAIDLIPFVIQFFRDYRHNCFLLTPSVPITPHLYDTSIFLSPYFFQRIPLLGRVSQFLTVSPNLFLRSPTSACLWLRIPSETDDAHLLELLLHQGLVEVINPRIRSFLTVFMSGIQNKMRMMLAAQHLHRIADRFFLKSTTPQLLSQAFAMKASEFVSVVLASLLNSSFPVYSLEWKTMTERIVQMEWWKIPNWQRAYNIFLKTAAGHYPIWSALFPLSGPDEGNVTIIAHIRLHLLRFVITLACDTLRYTLKIQSAGNEQFFVNYDGQFENSDDDGQRLHEKQRVGFFFRSEVSETNLLNPGLPMTSSSSPNIYYPPFFGSEF